MEDEKLKKLLKIDFPEIKGDEDKVLAACKARNENNNRPLIKIAYALSSFLVLTVIVVIGVLLFNNSEVPSYSGKESSNKPIKSDFTFSGGEANPIACDYKCDKTIFEIDNVYLDLYFGIKLVKGDVDTYVYTSYECFDICAENEEKKCIIDHREENLVQKKYGFEVDSPFPDANIIYNHSERIILPSELFENDKGKIFVGLWGVNEKDLNSEYGCICGIWLYYIKSQNTITIEPEA